jgi:hypothetical protein
MAIPASVRFRVIYHEPICPECGSPDIATEDVETGDGITETAFVCTACGEAWPLACVTDWDTRTPRTDSTPTGAVSDLEGGQ